MAGDPGPEHVAPLLVAARIVGMLALFAAFAVAFLVAPLIVLAVAVIGLAAAQRARTVRRRPPG